MTKGQRLISAGVIAGAAYGLAIRAMLDLKRGSAWSVNAFLVMSVAFIMVVPFAMGYITVAIQARKSPV